MLTHQILPNAFKGSIDPQVKERKVSEMSPGQGSRKLKILALHSFRTSSSIFQEQIQRSNLLNSIGDLVDLFFVDAPNLASGPIPDDVTPFFQGPYYEWWNAEKDEETGRWSYNNWRTSLAHIEDICSLHGPFDGVMGFSQGGAAAALLVGLQRTGRALKNQQMLGFCICFAGIRVRDPQLDGCFDALKSIPSVHVIGDKDPVKRMTNMLIESFDNPIVINHPKGHVVPQLSDGDVERMRAFLIARQKASSM